jgi:hypothetical protein
MSIHDLIDHGLTALMPSRAYTPARTITGAPSMSMSPTEERIFRGTGVAVLGGIVTVGVGAAMHFTGHPGGRKVAACGAAAVVIPPVAFMVYNRMDLAKRQADADKGIRP